MATPALPGTLGEELQQWARAQSDLPAVECVCRNAHLSAPALSQQRVVPLDPHRARSARA